MEFCTYRKRRESCTPYVGECSSGDVKQIQYGGRNRKQKLVTFQFRDLCGLKVDNKFLSDAEYIILRLTRELDIAPCHCQHGSCNRSNMAAQTGSTYIFGTSVNSVEIPTANLRFLTVTSSKRVPPDDFYNDQQLEVAIWLSRSDILITLATL